MSDLEKSILKTVIYYDALGQLGISCVEICRYLQKENDAQTMPSFYHLLSVLEQSPVIKKFLSKKNGFFFLKNREALFDQRILRQKIAIAKWRKIRRIALYLAFCPFLRGLMVSGSLAFSNTKKDSDLDLLVVTKKNRIWTGRTFLSLFLEAIGQRRHDEVIADRVCLNHYIAQNQPTVSLQNLSNAHLYAWLAPLTDYQSFEAFQKNNQWLKNFLFFYPQEKKSHLRRVNENGSIFRLGRLAAGFFEFVLSGAVGDQLEKRLAKWQTGRIKQKTHFRQLKENELYLSENTLIFHYPICKNTEVMEAYFKKVRQLAIA